MKKNKRAKAANDPKASAEAESKPKRQRRSQKANAPEHQAADSQDSVPQAPEKNHEAEEKSKPKRQRRSQKANAPEHPAADSQDSVPQAPEKNHEAEEKSKPKRQRRSQKANAPEHQAADSHETNHEVMETPPKRGQQKEGQGVVAPVASVLQPASLKNEPDVRCNLHDKFREVASVASAPSPKNEKAG